MPEIEEIRGVDAGGVIHTLMEKKLVVTSGRKNVVGRPILYRTSRDFLVHFGLKDVGELPSLKEFEELAKRALGSEWTEAPAPEPTAPEGPEPAPVTSAEVVTVEESGVGPPTRESLPSAVESTNPVENTEATRGESPVANAATLREENTPTEKESSEGS